MVETNFSGFLRKIIIMPKMAQNEGKGTFWGPKSNVGTLLETRFFFENVPDDRHWLGKYDSLGKFFKIW